MSKDTIYRQAAIDAATKYEKQLNEILGDENELAETVKILKHRIIALPSVQPDIIRCKDCKHWKDSDGVYRRGVDAESKCHLNTQEVYAGTFYCGYAERKDR